MLITCAIDNPATLSVKVDTDSSVRNIVFAAIRSGDVKRTPKTVKNERLSPTVKAVLMAGGKTENKRVVTNIDIQTRIPQKKNWILFPCHRLEIVIAKNSEMALPNGHFFVNLRRGENI